MEADPCEVCNGTETKLRDGFYYCIECGTQNTNVRETIVEQKALGDGTFALSTKRKIVKIDDSKVQMSTEWYKWHAYNFVILGLADELVAAGAKPSFKLKLLWIWTRYVKKYQNKDLLGLGNNSQENNNENITLPSFMIENTSNLVQDVQENEEQNKKLKNKNIIMDGSRRDIKFLSKGVILAMLYLALNLDESDIQLSHIYRFIKEKRLNFSKVRRFVPDDINLKSLQEQWISFLHSKVCNMHHTRALAMSLLRKLDLGTPKVPSLRKILDNILLELCLPNDIKPMIHSLMHLHRCDLLDLSNKAKENLVEMPDYEGAIMSYVLVALKMCFGLDGDYEDRLSDVVENINEDRNLSKSHRIGKYSEPSTRLFSFREWCNYMQCRKIMLGKSILSMAEQHCLDIEDYVYIEHMDHRPLKEKDLQDETAIDLISKIPEENDGRVIPKNLFMPTLTPMSDYTDIIIDHNQDPDIRLLLSEDFTQYSLKYACEYLELVDTNTNNIIKGVSEDRKVVKEVILGTIVTKKSKSEMVYVKNCENRNWVITNPPKLEHVTCEDVQNDKESDHGYDSENPSVEKEVPNVKNLDNSDQSMIDISNESHLETLTTIKEITNITDNVTVVSDLDNSKAVSSLSENDNAMINNAENIAHKENVTDTTDKFDDDSNKACDEATVNAENEKEICDTNENVIVESKKDNRIFIITEEESNKNIFDDSFEELDIKDHVQQNNDDDFDDNHELLQNYDTLLDDRASISDFSDDNHIMPTFNPDTFDRERTIKELILNACKKYKIPVPSEYKVPREPRKRKTDMFGNEEAREPRKRPKISRGETKKKVEELVGGYYQHMQSDLISKMQGEVSLAIRNTAFDSLLNGTQTEIGNPANVEISDALSIRDSVIVGPVENQSNVLQNSVLEQTVNKDQNPEEEEEIDELWESKLFAEDEEMKFDDLIPKGDPKFDEEKYDVNQLYMKVKVEDDSSDLEADPKLDEILKEKIEQCKNSTEFEKLKPVPVGQPVKTKYQSDSEDDIPLTAIQEEKKMVEKMLSWEENFDPLINKEHISEFKYWFRHYDTSFMTKSKDWHEKFDVELKENTPSSFYFVISECAAILNCSTFYLYKQMQNLEYFIKVKAKHPDK